MSELENVLIDTQKVMGRSNRTKDKIIVLLIVLLFLQAVVGYSGFVWYDSQFETSSSVTTETNTETDNTTVDLHSEGDSATSSYIEGSQYNDSAIHEDKGGEK